MPDGQLHWPAAFLKLPSGHGPATTGGVGRAGGATGAGVSDAAGAGNGGGACEGLATHRPFLNSCQGKHLSSAPEPDCECAGDEVENAKHIKIAVTAEKRVIQKPRRHPMGAKLIFAC
jgi:hypothetical protein